MATAVSGLVPAVATAQTAAPTVLYPRADASAAAGSFSAREPRAGAYNDWETGWIGSVSFGYSWSEHLKTEVEAGITDERNFYGSTPNVFIDGGYTSGPVSYRFSTRSLAIGQHYQFGHNAFFHPFIGGGVVLERVAETQNLGAVYVSIPDRTVSSNLRMIAPPRTVGPSTHQRVVAFVSSGFKAYMTERGFFRLDARAGFRERLEDVSLKFGFGIDFQERSHENNVSPSVACPAAECHDRRGVDLRTGPGVSHGCRRIRTRPSTRNDRTAEAENRRQTERDADGCR